ncbi:MAG TPA: helix-turn-helix transcriptional regulator [Nannocystaceae bacterium]|nr:helix-turn-helix transcriptional regulator [Nannocystaceae bacterium]
MAMDVTDTEQPVARLIREQGRQKQWVARQIGVSPSEMTKILRGDRVLTLPQAQRLAQALGVTIEDLAPTDAPVEAAS